MKNELCYKSTALKLLGLTPKNFGKLGLKPAKQVKNPHYRSGPPSYLYNKNDILSLVKAPEVLSLRPKPRKIKSYANIFNDKYPNIDDAILDAAKATFNMNRYCKHDSCSKKNMEEIYKLKNQFIKVLYQKKYCTQTFLHIKELPKQTCRSCNGTGIYPRYYKDDWDYDEEDNCCNKCGGTGIFKPARTLEFVVFKFEIGTQKFIWHQPKELVNFEYKITDAPGKLNLTEEKPLEISLSKLKEAKELVKWVIDANEKLEKCISEFISH